MMSEEEILKLITSHVPDKGRILEIGCKSGDMVRKIAKEAENIVYGINHSESAISEAKRRARYLRDIYFAVQKAEELNFPNNFFDLIYSMRTLHETWAKRALEEMHRVLIAEGVLIIVDWIKEAAVSWSETSYDPKELKELLESVGFTHFKIKVRNDLYVLTTRK